MFNVNIGLIYALLGVLALIFLNVILGVAIAIRDGTFDLQKLPEFLKTEVLPYGMSLTALAGAAQINFSYLAANVSTITTDALVALAWTAIGAYVLKLVQEIGQKIFKLFGAKAPES
jgi:hypothetical protein